MKGFLIFCTEVFDGFRVDFVVFRVLQWKEMTISNGSIRLGEKRREIKGRTRWGRKKER